MTDREKLIALLKSNMNVLQAAGTSATATLRLADLLIENGVTIMQDSLKIILPIDEEHAKNLIEDLRNCKPVIYPGNCEPKVELIETHWRWIPVSERLPDKCKDYLCLCNVDGHIEYPFSMVLRYHIVDEKPHFQHESAHGLHVTHWMPIPEPPKEVNQ